MFHIILYVISSSYVLLTTFYQSLTYHHNILFMFKKLFSGLIALAANLLLNHIYHVAPMASLIEMAMAPRKSLD